MTEDSVILLRHAARPRWESGSGRPSLGGSLPDAETSPSSRSASFLRDSIANILPAKLRSLIRGFKESPLWNGTEDRATGASPEVSGRLAVSPPCIAVQNGVPVRFTLSLKSGDMAGLASNRLRVLIWEADTVRIDVVESEWAAEGDERVCHIEVSASEGPISSFTIILGLTGEDGAVQSFLPWRVMIPIVPSAAIANEIASQGPGLASDLSHLINFFRAVQDGKGSAGVDAWRLLAKGMVRHCVRARLPALAKFLQSDELGPVSAGPAGDPHAALPTPATSDEDPWKIVDKRVSETPRPQGTPWPGAPSRRPFSSAPGHTTPQKRTPAFGRPAAPQKHLSGLLEANGEETYGEAAAEALGPSGASPSGDTPADGNGVGAGDASAESDRAAALARSLDPSPWRGFQSSEVETRFRRTVLLPRYRLLEILGLCMVIPTALSLGPKHLPQETVPGFVLMAACCKLPLLMSIVTGVRTRSPNLHFLLVTLTVLIRMSYEFMTYYVAVFNKRLFGDPYAANRLAGIYVGYMLLFLLYPRPFRHMVVGNLLTLVVRTVALWWLLEENMHAFYSIHFFVVPLIPYVWFEYKRERRVRELFASEEHARILGKEC